MPECISPLDQPRVPLDLYLPILNHVQNQSDLFSLSRVSREWHAETNLVLYRHVTILSDHKRQQVFFRMVTQDHGLALLVKEFTVEFCQPLSSEEAQIVQGGLHAMEHLENLSFHSTSDDSTARVLLEAPFQLRRFSWVSVRDLDEELVLQFLSRQSQLQDLEVFLHGTSILSYNVPAQTCPRLSVLRGSRASVNAFLPNRHITTLVWLPEFEECCDPLYDLHGPFSRLRVLQLGGKWMRPRITLLATHLTVLEVLELVHIWPDERDCLGTLTKLQCLILSNWSCTATPFPELPVESRGSIVDSFFTSNPSLKSVFIELPRKRDSERRYQLWVKPKTDCVIVPLTEVFKWAPIELSGHWD